jgi:hypothetical protein
MKKVLSTVAALGLVAGLASTAAAVEFKMSGKYYVEGYHLSDAATGGTGAPLVANKGVDLQEGAGDNNTSDSWYQHTFEIKPTMKVNDKISMFGTIRLADETVWGNQADGDVVSTSANNNDVYVHHLYMDYASEIGKIRIGRTPAGGYGTTFLDTDSRQNRIMWWPSFIPKPWSVLLYTGKVTEGDLLATDEGTANDSDHYEARLNFKNESLDAGIAYSMTNDNTYITGAAVKAEKELYKGYAQYKMDNFFVNAEVGYYTGDQTATVDYDSLGAMLQVGAKFDALTVSGMYFYAEGDDNTADSDNNSFLSGVGAVGTGTEFEPLYILTGRTAGLLNRDQASSAYAADMTNSGVHAFILAADYTVSDRLALHGAIAYAQADKENKATYLDRDDEYGFEYNVGAAYKLLDNLTYEAHFGYLDTGDYFKSTTATDDTENVYILSHHLTMTF